MVGRLACRGQASISRVEPTQTRSPTTTSNAKTKSGPRGLLTGPGQARFSSGPQVQPKLYTGQRTTANASFGARLPIEAVDLSAPGFSGFVRAPGAPVATRVLS
jgi:hypothetical protein